MSLKIQIKKHVLKFLFEAGTSRGTLKSKDSHIVKIIDDAEPDVAGLGEASLIPGLSIDDGPDFDAKLHKIASQLSGTPFSEVKSNYKALLGSLIPNELPSIKFAFETAILDLINGGKRYLFPGPFTQGKKSIPINGLIWMGDQLFMLKQIREKVKSGFNCIKIKVGAIDFQSECDLIEFIREQYPAKNIQLRLDANGAFSEEEVIEKLAILHEFNIHSIEQPVKAGNLQLMRDVVARSPVPVALDEELIGLFSHEEKLGTLKEIRPAFIVLKPSLLGGFEACREWISLAESLNIGWWITSALESNIGLNAIAQFTSTYSTDMYQGLGTGMLFENNFSSPLIIRKGQLLYNQQDAWDLNF